jgi:hypothetical protein
MYAPTADLGQIRLAIAIAAQDDLHIQLMDVSTAFVGVDLEDEI